MENDAFTDIEIESKYGTNGTNGATFDSRAIRLPAETQKKKPNCVSRVRNAMIHGLETVFYRIGITIAHHPYITIVLSILIPGLLSIGMVKFQFDEDFADLLLPPTSRIFADRAWVEEHVPYEQRPIRLILKTDNVLTRESLLGLYDFYDQFSKLTVEGGNNFDKLCVRVGNNCLVDSLLALWRNDNETISKLSQEEIIYKINTVTTNPMYFFDFNATRMMGSIEYNSTNHIVAAGIMHADWFIQSSLEIKPIAKTFEYKAIDLALAGHAGFDFINVFTIDSYSEEFFGGVYGDIILIVYGFPVVLLYIIFAIGKPNLVEHGVYLTFAAVLGVILSAGACFGLGLVSGFLFGAPHQALIFLLLAVGVDDAFVIMTTWTRINKANKDFSVEERVGLTMQHAGVSVTVTSFSDLVAFACGISTQMPVLQSFCVYCSIGILFLFLMQSTLFPACLTLNQHRVEKSRDALVPCIQHEESAKTKCSQRELVQPFIRDIFAPILLSTPGKIITILLTLGIAGVMLWGVWGLQKGYEIERSLPEDSYTRHFLQSQRLYFSAEGPGIQTFCGPMDYPKNIVKLDKMVNEYVNSSVIMYGLVANWIPLFKLYVKLKKGFGMKMNLTEDGFPVDEDVFYEILEEYFGTALGLPFSKYIEFTDDPSPRVKWTYFPMQQIVSQDVWENEYIMEEVRRIADTAGLEGGTCFVYSLFHIFTEVIRYVDAEITRNFVLAGVAVFLVTLLLIVDIITSTFVLICVCLTTLDIMGALQFWDFYLDVNLVVLLIISIGLAVDFSAHIGYHFMTVTGTRKERAINTLCQIGPAIWHGAVTTFLVFFVLIFGRSLSAFFAVFVLVVLFGLFHGMCFLPVVLSIVGPDPYYNAGPSGTEMSEEKRILHGSHSNKSSNPEFDKNQSNQNGNSEKDIKNTLNIQKSKENNENIDTQL